MDTRKLWEVLDMSMTLTFVMVSQVFANVQIHPSICIRKYGSFYINSLSDKKKNKILNQDVWYYCLYY